jgi:hypothetical protein
LANIAATNDLLAPFGLHDLLRGDQRGLWLREKLAHVWHFCRIFCSQLRLPLAGVAVIPSDSMGLSSQLKVRQILRPLPIAAPHKSKLFADFARRVVVLGFPDRIFPTEQSKVDSPPADVARLPRPCDHWPRLCSALRVKRVLLGLGAAAAGYLES